MATEQTNITEAVVQVAAEAARVAVQEQDMKEHKKWDPNRWTHDGIAYIQLPSRR